MKLKIGTAYFLSKAKAIRYYRDYESDPKQAVETKLAEHSIHIGAPELKASQRLMVIDGGTRYGIME